MTQHDRIQEIKQAILWGESHYQGTELPTGQTTGSAMQRSSYAFEKATEFFNQNY